MILASIAALSFSSLCTAQDKKPDASPTPAKAPAATLPVPAAPAASDAAVPADSRLEVVAEFPGLQATGVAVSKTGRLFACFPRWHESFKHSVVEVLPDRTSTPYPNPIWNEFTENSEEHRGIQFVCVQSIKVDEFDALWALDAASPRMEGAKRTEFDGGGPKLIEFDLAANKPRRIMQIPGLVATEQTYLNDFEIDHPNKIVYITDSGTGCLILLNLKTRESKRVLDRHPSTKADPEFQPVIGGAELRDKKGLVPQVHADGIAFDRANGYLYYQALTGKTLYRLKTQVLIDVLPGRSLTGEQKNTIAAAVEEVGQTVMTDGMMFDAAGNLYFSALERDAIVVRTPEGEMHDLIAGRPISWPDSFAVGPAIGPPSSKTATDSEPLYLYFTNSQIHLTDWFSPDGSMPSEPYRILKTRLYNK